MDWEKETAASLEKALAKYDRIILIDGRYMGDRSVHVEDAMEQFKNLLQELTAMREIEKRILILMAGDKEESHSWNRGIDFSNIVWLSVTEDEMSAALKLYHLYEFSNRILVISSSTCTGSLLNYASTGVLTVKEALDAFLR